MKLERVNDKQIRCTLEKEDLEKKHLSITDLLRGTPKAKEFFQTIMMRASIELGFEVKNSPLMIEAFPAQSGNAFVLLITKIADEDADQDYMMDDDEDDWNDDLGNIPMSLSASDKELLTHLIAEETAEISASNLEEDHELGGMLAMNNDGTRSHYLEPPILKEYRQAEQAKQKTEEAYSVYRFDNLSTVITVCKRFNTSDMGAVSVYKDPEQAMYYMVFSSKSYPKEKWYYLDSALCELGYRCQMEHNMLSYYQEHYICIANKNAITKLAQL